MRLAIVGATGLVGRTMLEVLSERDFPVNELILVASKKSKGEKIVYKGKEKAIITLPELVNKNVDVALFSAGSEISKEWAPKLIKKGCRVVDNSSFWRMDNRYKLIVPEVNSSIITKKDFLIANPNCSTIPLVMVLHALHKKFQVSRVIVSTYQSVTGTGKKGIDQLNNEEKNIQKKQKVYPHSIYRNVIPHCDVFNEDGYTKEEMKLTNETKKILDKNIEVTATAVRVPVVGGHSESVNITFKKSIKLSLIYKLLRSYKGIVVQDEVLKNNYPMPVFAKNKDEVFVGRIRKDFSLEKTINLWICSDNLRKGAATNAIQIVEHLVKNKFV